MISYCQILFFIILAIFFELQTPPVVFPYCKMHINRIQIFSNIVSCGDKTKFPKMCSIWINDFLFLKLFWGNFQCRRHRYVQFWRFDSMHKALFEFSIMFVPHFNFVNSLDFTCFCSKNRIRQNFSKFFHLHKETVVCKPSLYIVSNSSWNERHLKSCSIVIDSFFIAFFAIVRLPRLGRGSKIKQMRAENVIFMLKKQKKICGKLTACLHVIW